MKNTVVKREAAPAAIQGGKVDFSEVAGELYPVRPADVAVQVKAHLAAAALFSRLSLAHAIAAGWLLYSHKLHTPHGLWQAWCMDALGVSHKTADRYIGLFMATVGAARNTDGVPLENSVSPRELECATVGMEDKSVTRAMIDLGVIRRSGKWGGDRREEAAANGHAVGRPSKGAAAEVEAALDAAANYEPAMWASAEGAIGTLLGLDRDKDFLRRLTDEHLAVAARSLADLSKKAGELLSARLARRDMGLHGDELETSEVLKVLERGL